MKLLLFLAILPLTGCAYFAKDIYRYDNEIQLQNNTADRATAHVTYAEEKTVTSVEPGERAMIFYGKATGSGSHASVSVSRTNHGDVEIRLPMILSKPSVSKLWERHNLLLTPTGELIHEEE
jgi:hypothetical protein